MEDINVSKAQDLFNIKKNQLKLVQRRGYDISKEQNILDSDAESFLDAYIPFALKNHKTLRGVMSQLYTKDDGTKLYVYFSDPVKTKKYLGITNIGILVQKMDSYKCRNAIIITSLPVSPSAKKKLQELLTYNVDVFLESEMAYDPTEHYLTPKHRLLTTEQQRNFLAKNKIDLEQIPIMLTSDMISRYYGYRPGQVIEITRINLYDTMIQDSLSYRCIRDE